MKIVWKDFTKEVVLDYVQLKRVNYTEKISALFEEIGLDVAMADSDISKHHSMEELIAHEASHPQNEEYMTNICAALKLWHLIHDSAKLGVHFRLEDGRQIGPIKTPNTLLEQAGDGAILLSYGVEVDQPIRATGSKSHKGRRSFTKEALQELRDKQAQSARAITAASATLAQTSDSDIRNKLKEILEIIENSNKEKQ